MGPGETFIALIIGVTVLGYLFMTGRHRERMAIIESGTNMSIFDSQKRMTGRGLTLKIGMLFVGVACGILLGELLRNAFHITPGVAYMSMILLFGGIALILNYVIDRKDTV